MLVIFGQFLLIVGEQDNAILTGYLAGQRINQFLFFQNKFSAGYPILVAGIYFVHKFIGDDLIYEVGSVDFPLGVDKGL